MAIRPCSSPGSAWAPSFSCPMIGDPVGGDGADYAFLWAVWRSRSRSPSRSAAMQSPDLGAAEGLGARGGGLSTADAGMWSARPVRLIEIFVPRLFGDPSRDEEDLFFGALQRQAVSLPAVSLPGMLLAILGTGRCCVRREAYIPKRRALMAGAGLGVFFGLGRFNPLFPVLRLSCRSGHAPLSSSSCSPWLLIGFAGP